MIKNWIRLLKLSLIKPNQSHLSPHRVRNMDPLDQFTALDKLAFSETLKCTKNCFKTSKLHLPDKINPWSHLLSVQGEDTRWNLATKAWQFLFYCWITLLLGESGISPQVLQKISLYELHSECWIEITGEPNHCWIHVGHKLSRMSSGKNGLLTSNTCHHPLKLLTQMISACPIDTV